MPEGTPLAVPPLPPAGLKPLKKRKVPLFVWIVSGVLLVLILAGLGFVAWYNVSLSAVNSSDTRKERVVIETGDTSKIIAGKLKGASIIRSANAFDIYTGVKGYKDKLRTGTYVFSPNQSVETIVDHIVNGKTDQFSLTILPGQTLAQFTQTLLKDGYAQSEIDAAFAASYDSPLLADRPAGASLEGYLYPETYFVAGDEPLQATLTRVFAEYYKALEDNNIIAGFQAHGFNIHQGITLASIVEREVPGAEDRKQVAEVFYNRLAKDMVLGSDITYIYGASLTGQTASPSLDSPYNTRIVKGLPPTPVSNPGLTSLQAVAYPAQNSYLFFLSGDDDITYYATTDAEHSANIQNHCKVKCQ